MYVLMSALDACRIYTLVTQLHVATLTGLAPNTRYYYQVGDPTFTYWSDPEWSQPPYMNFVTRPLNLNSTRAIIFGLYAML